MIKKILALLMAMFAAAAFAAADVNTATQAELETVKGIGPSISTKILDARKNGPFKDWNDLVTRVKGIGDKNGAKLSEAGLTVNGAALTGAPLDPSAVRKPEKASKTATATTPVAKTAPAAAATTAAVTPAATPAVTPAAKVVTPAAAPAPTSVAAPATSASSEMSAADKKAAAKKERDDKKAAKAQEKADKKAAKAAAAVPAASAASAPAKK